MHLALKALISVAGERAKMTAVTILEEPVLWLKLKKNKLRLKLHLNLTYFIYFLIRDEIFSVSKPCILLPSCPQVLVLGYF